MLEFIVRNLAEVALLYGGVYLLERPKAFLIKAVACVFVLQLMRTVHDANYLDLHFPEQDLAFAAVLIPLIWVLFRLRVAYCLLLGLFLSFLHWPITFLFMLGVEPVAGR